MTMARVHNMCHGWTAPEVGRIGLFASEGRVRGALTCIRRHQRFAPVVIGKIGVCRGKAAWLWLLQRRSVLLVAGIMGPPGPSRQDRGAVRAPEAG